MDKKIGVYICTGCGIGDALDIDALQTVVTDDTKAAVCQTHEYLCGEEGCGLIRQAIEGGEVDHVVVAACSMREKRPEFSFPGTFVERTNLREHVVWSHEPADEDTQWLAEDYLRMAVARTEVATVPEPHVEEISQQILVIGGGMTGMNAALHVARAGKEVVLVEKSDALGGFARRLHQRYPASPPYREPEAVKLAETVSAVEGADRIKVHLNTTVGQIAGAPGRFEVSLKNGSGAIQETVGTIVVAAGFRPYDGSKLSHLGYGAGPDVVTSAELEDLAREGKLVRPSDGAPIKRAVFVQCAGSRDPEHLPYCSNVCCTVSLKQVGYLKATNPDVQATVLHRDMRTIGQAELYYQSLQEQAEFVRAEIESVAAGGNGAKVTAKDLLSGEQRTFEADLVVLAVGMQPVTDEPILNLAYRQGPEMPELKDGFPNSHFICFPYESRRTGIFVAGPVRKPMDLTASLDDAAGAAFKAVKALTLLGEGKALHPRVGDQSWPDFFLQRCTQCKRCTEECPYGALDEDEKGTPKPNPTRCRRCGVCMGACPERIVNFADYSVQSVNSMIKAIKVPEEWEEKPALVGLFCENDAYPAFDMAGARGIKHTPYLRLISMRCLGGLNLQWIADALAKGIDGVMLFGCRYGDDYSCHNIQGSELCNTRLSKVQETLDRLMLESDRVCFHQLEIDEYDRIPELVGAFMEKLEEVGPNPFKD